MSFLAEFFYEFLISLLDDDDDDDVLSILVRGRCIVDISQNIHIHICILQKILQPPRKLIFMIHFSSTLDIDIDRH